MDFIQPTPSSARTGPAVPPARLLSGVFWRKLVSTGAVGIIDFPIPAFGVSVCGVVHGCPKEKMGGVYARLDITLMTHPQSGRDWPIVYLPRKAMSVHRSVACPNPAVACNGTSGPKPATLRIWSLFYSGPELVLGLASHDGVIPRDKQDVKMNVAIDFVHRACYVLVA